MAAISKTTAKKRMITRTLASSVETQGAQLAATLNTVLFEGNPPYPLTMDDVVGAFITVLQKDYTHLVRTDQLVATEKGQDDQMRALRDRLIARVRERLFSTRNLLEGSFGTDVINALGLSGRTPETLDGLITYGRNVQTQLEEGLRAYETLLGLNRPDLGTMAAHLGQDLDKLEAAVDAVRGEVRETEAAQAANNRANEVWSRHYAPVAGILEGFYRLAEMDAQADRLRPTSRRRAGLPEPVDIEGADDALDIRAFDPAAHEVEPVIELVESS